MKKILLKLLFLSPCLMFAQTMDSSVIVRVNGIYVDEIVDGGDEGVGGMAEIAFIVEQTEDIYQTIGIEAGIITSDFEGSLNFNGFGLVEAEVDTDLIPVFANYTIGGQLGNTGLIIEAGAGIGGVFVDFDASATTTPNETLSDSDDDIVFAGQFFSRLGYKITDAIRLSVGVRYMIADDASVDLDGDADANDVLELLDTSDTLNSLAVDAGLSISF